MRVTIMGTAAAEGWPAIYCTCAVCAAAHARGGKELRTRASYMVDDDIMVDAGPDIYGNMIRFGKDYSTVTTQLITHSHGDHLLMHNFEMRGPVFAHEPTHMDVYGNMTVAPLFEAEESDMRLSFHTMRPFDDAAAKGVRITALRALHDRAEECLIFLIERGGKTLFVSNDTGYYPEDTWAALKGRTLDGVLFDCTCGPRPEGTNHMGIPDVVRVKSRLADMGCLHEKTRCIITHFSHNCGMTHEQLCAEGAKCGLETAFDGLTFDL